MVFGSSGLFLLCSCLFVAAPHRLALILPPLQSVWASKYNDRAYMSTRKVGINFDDIRMAVLCQRVVPAQVRGRCSC